MNWQDKIKLRYSKEDANILIGKIEEMIAGLPDPNTCKKLFIDFPIDWTTTLYKCKFSPEDTPIDAKFEVVTFYKVSLSPSGFAWEFNLTIP